MVVLESCCREELNSFKQSFMHAYKRMHERSRLQSAKVFFGYFHGAFFSSAGRANEQSSEAAQNDVAWFDQVATKLHTVRFAL